MLASKGGDLPKDLLRGAAGFRLGVSTAGHAAVFPTRFGHWPSDW